MIFLKLCKPFCHFAGNAVATAIIGAISGNLIYEYIKNIFYVKGHGLTWAEAGVFGDIYYAKATALRRRAVPTWGVFIN